jgi:excisionase family DNA binding protein
MDTDTRPDLVDRVHPDSVFSISEASRYAKTCRTALYEQIRLKKLIARKRGRRTLILRSDLDAWLHSLPKV